MPKYPQKRTKGSKKPKENKPLHAKKTYDTKYKADCVRELKEAVTRYLALPSAKEGAQTVLSAVDMRESDEEMVSDSVYESDYYDDLM